MWFGIFLIIVIVIVAYWHYVQGLFSATISAICAAVAAIVAVSYHETIIAMLFKGAMANQAEAMMLCALFALTYFILRLIADKTLPGNVRYPVAVDKIGAAAMGAVAGIFGTGVFALAAGSLPFGPSIASYTRYSVADRSVVVPGPRGNVDVQTDSEVKDINLNDRKTALDPSKRTGLILPVDDIVTGVVGQLSTGALSNDRPMYAVHPDWPTELFGQRAGVQVGTKRVLLNLPGLTMVTLKDLYTLASVPEIDAELRGMRETPLVPDKGDIFKPAGDETLLIARVNFDQNATDDDGKVRVSPFSVRLVGWTEEGGSKSFRNYHPIGTLQDAATLFRNKPDDFLIVPGGKSVDFVFDIPRDAVFTDASAKPKELKIKDGVFLEVKRMAQMDLSGKEVKGPPPYDKNVEVLRKPLEAMKNLPKRTESGQLQAAVETTEGPIEVSTIKVSNQLFSPVNPGQYNGDTNVSFRSGNATMKNKQFAKLVVTPTDSLTMLKGGAFPTADLYVPAGKKMVQVVAKTPARGDSWGWIDLSQFDLVESTGNKFKPNGAAARVKVEGADRMVANYDAENPVSSIDKGDGRVYDVYLLFNVPAGTKITQLNWQDKPIKAENVTVP